MRTRKRSVAKKAGRPARGRARTPSKKRPTKKKDTTSWGHVAEWYHEHVTAADDTYHEKVVKPNLLRVLGDIRGKRVLDLACGEGFFSRAMREEGGEVTGVDIAPELIKIAKEKGPNDITYLTAESHHIPVPEHSFDIAVCVLALQNIKELSATVDQVAHLLEPHGTFVMVLNHPAFRIPQRSQWGFDAEANVQFRRLDGYLSESSHKIQMHPGSAPDVTTVSYHRPLQVYMKELFKHGFAVTGFEEWISHRVSEEGPRKEAEDRARKEFPLFLMLKAHKA